MNKKISQGKKLRKAIIENVPLQIVGTVNAYSSLLAEKKGHK
ncbi:MAG TPA: methylisocitrate lyase, partial [Gammaproteobacteria bacterium]|nr:methylisocitrate lyase [Gammaproteobacteria bacterium]